MRMGDWMDEPRFKNGSFGHLIPAREAGVLGARHNSTPRLDISKLVSLSLSLSSCLVFLVLTKILFNSDTLETAQGQRSLFLGKYERLLSCPTMESQGQQDEVF